MQHLYAWSSPPVVQRGPNFLRLREARSTRWNLFLVSDFDQEGFFPPHAGIHSALVVPLLHQKRLVGLLQLHSKKPAYFDAKAMDLAETLAIQAAVALSNAWLYQSELQRSEVFRRRSETLTRLSNASYAIGPDVSLEESLRVIGQGIHDSTPFQVVLVSLYEPEGGQLRRVVGIGIPQETLNELLARKQPYSALLQLMKPTFKVSRSYYILQTKPRSCRRTSLRLCC